MQRLFDNCCSHLLNSTDRHYVVYPHGLFKGLARRLVHAPGVMLGWLVG